MLQYKFTPSNVLLGTYPLSYGVPDRNNASAVELSIYNIQYKRMIFKSDREKGRQIQAVRKALCDVMADLSTAAER
jgi:hypothetical protein